MGCIRDNVLVLSVITGVRNCVKDVKERRHFYADFIDYVEDFACDTLDESKGIDPVFDAVLDKKRDPNRF